MNGRGTKKHPLTEQQKLINRSRSRRLARGEHAFHVVKQLWALVKARYRGLAKNLARAQTMFGLTNLYLVRRRLRPTDVVPCPP